MTETLYNRKYFRLEWLKWQKAFGGKTLEETKRELEEVFSSCKINVEDSQTKQKQQSHQEIPPK